MLGWTETPRNPASTEPEIVVVPVAGGGPAGGGVIVSAMVVEWVAADPVPVTVTVVGPPTAATAATVNVNEVLAFPDSDGVPKTAVTLAGRPLTLSAAAWALPEVRVVEIVLAAVPPCPMERVFGDAAMLKSLAWGGVQVTVAPVAVIGSIAAPLPSRMTASAGPIGKPRARLPPAGQFVTWKVTSMKA